MEENGMKVKNRKYYQRPTTARFDTNECKLILMAMSYAKNHGVFVNEGSEAEIKAYGIMSKLKQRIKKEIEKRDKERTKKNKVLEETKNEIQG